MENEELLFWHYRFLQQSRWTHAVRQFLLAKVTIDAGTRVLDVGFGTGAVINDKTIGSEFHGIDINFDYLSYAGFKGVKAFLTNGDALYLPYAHDCFDIVTCHFLLLWVKNPVQAVLEMNRVCRPGGALLFFAEPDYGGRLDYPSPLEELGQAQIDSLRFQGADPFVGRKLLEIASAAGLQNTQIGILGYQTEIEQDVTFWDNEWDVLQKDLELVLSRDKLENLHKEEHRFRMDGVRILFVPTFYLYAMAP